MPSTPYSLLLLICNTCDGLPHFDRMTQTIFKMEMMMLITILMFVYRTMHQLLPSIMKLSLQLKTSATISILLNYRHHLFNVKQSLYEMRFRLFAGAVYR